VEKVRPIDDHFYCRTRCLTLSTVRRGLRDHVQALRARF
jgi:hypothetical protein